MGLATPKVASSTPDLMFSGNNLGQVVHTHVPLSPSSIILYLLRGGNALRLGRHRTGHVSQTLVVYPSMGSRPIRKGDKHLAYTPHEIWHTLFVLITVMQLHHMLIMLTL